MPGGRRPRQVAELLQAEIAALVQRDLRDPRIGFVTVTGVRLSADLRDAKVYVSVLEPSREEEAVAALERAAGYLRRSLAGRIHLKQIPRLRFRPDPSVREGARIEDLLSELSPEGEGEGS